MISSEAVAANLFNIARKLQDSPTTPFKLVSRRWRMWDKVPTEQIPAFFQFQSPTQKLSGGLRPLLKREMRVLWMVYLPVSQNLNDVVSPALNRYFDALINALQTSSVTESGVVTLNAVPSGTVQSLGFPGKVTGCYADGDALTDEGLLSTYSLLVIPITILYGVT
jgi:hypothetical protein